MDNSSVRSIMYESPITYRHGSNRKASSLNPRNKNVRSNITSTIIKKNWIRPQVERIPHFYPLEQTHRILHNIELDEITKNLCECFHALSIQARFKERPARAALLTPEFIEINLYLWKVGTAGSICVELQRGQGDRAVFHRRYAKYILQAASGNVPTNNEQHDFHNHSNNERLTKSILRTRTEYSSSTTKDQESFLRSAKFTTSLIRSDRIETKILGMESLCILTDSRKTNLDISLYVSRAIIFGGHPYYDQNIDHFARTVHEFVTKMIQIQYIDDKEFEDAIMEVEYDSDDDDEYFGNEIDEARPRECIRVKNTIQNYGLVALSNALETLTMSLSIGPEATNTHLNNTNRASSDRPLNINKTFLTDDRFCKIPLNNKVEPNENLLISLLKEVDCAISRPHNACLAAKCLHLFCRLSDGVIICARLKSASGLEITRHAEEIGKATNVRLWQECKGLRLVLCDDQ